MATARAALRLIPNSADDHYQLGLAYLHQGRTEDATEAFHEALRAKPDHAEARLSVAHASRRQGKVQEAATYFKKHVRLTPQDTATRLDLAGLLSDQKDFARTIREFEGVIRQRVDLPGAHYAFPVTLERVGLKGRGRQECRLYLQLFPNAPDAAEARAHVKKFRGAA